MTRTSWGRVVHKVETPSPDTEPDKLLKLSHEIPAWGPPHDTYGLGCWCNPEPDVWDLMVIVHFPPEDAGH